MTQTKAVLKHAAISPQKVRLIIDQIRGKKIAAAMQSLSFSNKKAAAIVKKLLHSAISNAEHNDAADIDGLRVSVAFVDAAPTLKRGKPRAKGKSDRVIKRRSHITIIVES
ncbi:MAG: 50S ribosomal protein L22 [Legionellales bacterium]|nr:MAG: 50S ribosomal protein L22 [Legionellales bacterium]